MDSWQRLLPGWPVKRWDESNSPLDNGYARAALSGGHWSRLSNFVRLYAMHEEGGVYLDTDVEVVRDLTPLLENECFLGFQLKSEDEDWVNHAVMGSRAGHWFPESCIRRTLELFEQTGTLHRGPAVATSVLRNAGLRAYGLQDLAGVRLYPTDYFYPYSWLETFSPACLTENTYSIHHWARSWLEQ